MSSQVKSEKVTVEIDWKEIGQQVEEEMGSQGMSSERLSRKVGVARRTIDRLRSGKPVRTQTLYWVEEALKVKFRTENNKTENAPISHGGYSKQSVRRYIKNYAAFRRSYDYKDGIVVSHIIISWDDEVGALRYKETQENVSKSGVTFNYSFDGDVWLPPDLGIVHLAIHGRGRGRLITMKVAQDEDGIFTMKGFVMALNELRDFGYYPVTSPLLMCEKKGDFDIAPQSMDQSNARYEQIDSMLTEIEKKFLASRA
jgi:transcriptional regulator with XRE-family HTH domain